MAPPWADPTNPLIYILLGFLSAVTVIAVMHMYRMHKKIDNEVKEAKQDNTLRTDNIGLSKKAEDVLNQVLDDPMLQNKLPGELTVSKATVSNAVSELRERRLVKRKKKGNTYLIEPDREELEEQQR